MSEILFRLNHVAIGLMLGVYIVANRRWAIPCFWIAAVLAVVEIVAVASGHQW